MKKIYVLVFSLVLLSSHQLPAQSVLYGLTSKGGQGGGGALIKFDPATNQMNTAYGWDLTGSNPNRNDLVEFNGKLYGMTSSGGSSNVGTIFSFDPATNSHVKLFDFNNTNGSYPNGGFIVYNGRLFGMTGGGGSADYGTIFSFDPTSNTHTKLFDFSGANGRNPNGKLLESDGILYGTTYNGGTNGFGTLFSFDPTSNSHVRLSNFTGSNGVNPNGSLVKYDNKLYGMTRTGGCSNCQPGSGSGTIFSFDLSNNTHTRVFAFSLNNGLNPNGSLVINGNKLYGMTVQGGIGNGGTLFSFDLSTSTYVKQFDFNSVSGRYPLGGLLVEGDKLFGMTNGGGINNSGTIFSFELSSSTFMKLFDFATASGSGSTGSLIQSGGILYGTTQTGSASNKGTIFKYDLVSNTYSMLFDFLDINGSVPYGGLVVSQGKLYGMTNKGGAGDQGTVFSFDPVTNTQTRLFDFVGSNGSSPNGSLVLLGGKLYGMTTMGGSSEKGTLFSFDPLTNSHTLLFEFGGANGENPLGSLTVWNGRLYGMTNAGGILGFGTIFSFDPTTNTYATMFEFPGALGGGPYGSLVTFQGKFYGMTYLGGNNAYGSIFSFEPSSLTYEKIFDFDNTDGSFPTGDLVVYGDKLYGMTNRGGTNGSGTIFSFDPVTNTHVKRFDFSEPDGTDPFGSLMEFGGKLYGMTFGGGSSQVGTVFSFDPATNTYAKQHDFDKTNGSNPHLGASFVVLNSCIPTAEICDGVDNDCDGLIDEGCNDRYFRSRQSGYWSAFDTWESSADSVTWNSVARLPLPTDSTIVVRSGDSVTYSSFNLTTNLIVVEQGATLIFESGSLLNLKPRNILRPSIEVNGIMVTKGNCTVFGDNSGQVLLVNGVYNLEGGGILMSNPSRVIISSTGVLNMRALQGNRLEALTNFGTVNWLFGDYAYAKSLPPVNYGEWRDSTSGQILAASGGQLKNWGTYRKIGGNTTFSGTNAMIRNRGIITGVGRIDFGKGDSSLNLGIINPGDSIGKLTLAFRQTNSISELNIEIGSPANVGHDVLEIEGNLVLGGTLSVSELFIMPDTSLTIVRKLSGSLSGTFTTTNLPPNYSIQYLTDSVVLVKAAPVTPRNISILNPTAISEGNYGQKTLKFVVRLNQASAGTVQVNYASADSTATAGEDYVTTAGTLSIPAGQLTDTIRVLINGDRLVEAAERFKLVLSNPVNAIITTAQAIGTINNDDVLPAISITSYSMTEGTGRDSLLQMQVRLANAYPLPVTVNFATADSTATDGTDYTGVSGTLTFAPGDTLEFIPVLVKGDGIDEANEIVNVNLSNAVNATLTATTRGRITINDDDQIPGIVVSNVTVTEKDIVDTVIQVPVRLNRRYVETVTINYTSADSTATNGIDYDGVSGTLTFVPGDTLEFIPINIRGDRIDEPNEIIKLSYFGVVNATPASANSRVTITDNDVVPAVQFTNLSIPEGNNGGTAALTLQVRLSKAYPLPVTVAYATSDSTAIAGDDYTAVSGTLTFAPEETVQTISLPVNGDYLAEGTEIIKLGFSSPTNATVSATPSRISLTNDDVYPTVTASVVTITEGNTGTLNQVVTVRLSKRYPLPVAVQLATSDLTAIAGQDYTATSTTLIFPAMGDTLQTALVPVIGDLLDEANETYRITLSNPQYGILGGGGIATATINDNDPVPAIRVSDSIAAEADGQISFRVSLSNPSGRVVTVNWATQDGTALAGTDYTAVVSGSLSLQPGETEKILVVSLLTDSEAEPNETFTLLLSGAVNGTLTAGQGGDATATGTIQNSVSTSVNRSNSGSGLMDRSPSAPLQVKVLPNPSTNRFTLNFSGGSSEKILLRVTDIQGGVVEARTLGASMQTVQVGESWNSGTYIVEVVQGSDRKTLQLIKLK